MFCIRRCTGRVDSTRVLAAIVGTLALVGLAACGGVEMTGGEGDAASADDTSVQLDTGAPDAAGPREDDAATSRDAGAIGDTGGGATSSGDSGATARADAASSADAGATGATDAASDAGDAGRLGPTVHLNATWYDATAREGNCAFGTVSASAMLGSVSTDNYAGSQACGECVRVTGARGTIVVPVYDRCAGCTNDQVNLSAPAFEAAVGPLSIGRGMVTWEPVPCDVMGPVQYYFHAAASSRWLALQMRNHRIEVRSLEVRVGTDWVPLARSNTNYFIAATALGSGPFAFRVTAIDGQVIIDTGIALRPATAVPGGHQFL